MTFDPAHVIAAGKLVFTVAIFRASPIVAFTFLAQRGSFLSRVVLGVVAGAAIYWSAELSLLPWGWLVASYCYFACLAALTWVASGLLRLGRITSGGAFVASACSFFILPAMIFPPIAKPIALVLGWDLMLSSYSYSVETSKQAAPPARLKDCLFFLLVNPVLVYTNRPRRLEKAEPIVPAIRRGAWGLLMLFGASALLLPLYVPLKTVSASSQNALAAVPIVIALGAVRFLMEYWRQAGLANFQIGMLRLLGYEVPERFIRPISARDPADLWRRWNTYVGQWLLRYVYWPFSLHYGRRWNSKRLAMGVGVLVTFATIGALHDANTYAELSIIELRLSRLFLVNGIVVLLWLAVTLVWRAKAGSSGADTKLEAWPSVLSRVLLWTVIFGCFSRL